MMECRVCGESFDPADLVAVFAHEHQGLADTPERRDALDQACRGERVDGPR